MGTTRRPWSDKDKRVFIYLLKKHTDKYEIEKTLNRSEASINARLYKMYKTTDLSYIYERT